MKVDMRLVREARPARRDLALTVALGVLAGISVVAQARILSLVVDEVFLQGSGLERALPALVAFLLVSLVRASLTWGSEASAQRVAGSVKARLWKRLARRLLRLGPAYAMGERSGELANTVLVGVDALDAYFRQYLPQLAFAALIPAAVLLVVFPLDWLSGLVLLLTAPLLPIFMWLIGSAAEEMTKGQWISLSRMSAHFLDVLQGLATLKTLGRSRAEIRTIALVSNRFRRATMGVLRVAFLSALVLEMVATLSTAVVAVQIGLRVLYGRLAFDEALFVLIVAPQFYLPLRMLGARFHSGMEGVAAAQRIYEVLETAPEDPVPGGLNGADVDAEPVRCDLRFSEVFYAYEHGQRPALNGASFEIAAGQNVALVGPSGGGKSTVASLLLRFIEPQQGRIEVDGRCLQCMSPGTWREQVAWVPQSPYLFHGTVVENIRLARPDAPLEDVVKAAESAHARAFIEKLPQSYDTHIGERGARLSGGQAQRIALARAFLKDAPLLVFDEATANLDPETEDLIQEAILRLLEGRTALIIAHRLRTVAHADRIMVMEGGRVVEEGTHATLLQRGGLYSRMTTAYADWRPA
ncbi:thiol reductant ABC exporter subunit CydD [Chloroflexota bacterium]